MTSHVFRSKAIFAVSLLFSALYAEVGDVWVTSPLDSGSVTSSPCGGAVTSPSDACQSISSTNSCCTFTNALNSLQTAPYVGGRIFVKTDVEFTGPLMQQASGIINIFSVDSERKTIDFNDLYADNGLSINIAYSSSFYSGMYFINNVCFTNGVLGLSGGMVVVNSLNGWKNNAWITKTSNSIMPTLAFSSGSYPSDYDNSIQVNDTLYLEPANGTTVTLAGQITKGTNLGELIIVGGGTICLFNKENNYEGGTVLGNGVGVGNIAIQDSSVLDGAGNPIAGPIGLGDLTMNDGASLTVLKDIFLANNITAPLTASVYINIEEEKEFVLDGTLSVLGALRVNAAGHDGTLTLTGTNSIRSLRIEGGFVSVGSLENLGTPSTCLFSSGILLATDTFSMSTPLHLLSAGGGISVAQEKEVTVTGVISGDGTLTKYGQGTLVLEAFNTYTGKTYVNQGTLVVNGSIVASGDPIVSMKALLSGSGTVGPSLVFGGIAGGSPLGILTVSGDLSLFEQSFLGISITGSAGSSVAVTGNLTIERDTKLLIAPLSGSYSDPVTVTVSTVSGAISGQFNELILGPGFFLDGVLDYQTHLISLTYTPRTPSALAKGKNAKSVADVLDNAIQWNRSHVNYAITPSGLVPDTQPYLLELLNTLLPFTTTTAMTQALNQLYSAFFKGATLQQEENVIQVSGILRQRMQSELDVQGCCKKSKKTYNTWLSGLSDSVHQSTTSNSAGPQVGYQNNMAGFVAGLDRFFAEYFYTGLLGGYTNSKLTWSDSQGSGHINTGYAGVYFSALGELFYGNTALIGGWNEYSANRNIQYPGVNLTAKSSHPGKQLLVHADTGVNWQFSGFTIRPFDSFDYVTQKENPYTETNSGEWNLHAKSSNAILLRNELGLQFSRCFCFCSSKWTISPKASWVREARLKGESIELSFSSFDETFSVDGYFPDKSFLSTGVILTAFVLDDSLSFNLYYDGEFGSGYSSQQYGGQVRYSF